jgi:hypothetical protein
VIRLLESIARASTESRARKLLGDIYRAGGDLHNVPLAIQNYERAASLGDGWAMLALGDLLSSGTNDRDRLDKAAVYYHDAAQRGIARAFVRLGDLNWRTRPATSVAYYRRAEELGDPLAGLRIARTQQREFSDHAAIIDAIQRYQTALTTAGPEQTIKHLFSGERKGLITIVQWLLVFQGYDAGEIDGLLGPRTTHQIERFCRDRRITTCEPGLHAGFVEALLSSTEIRG